MDNFWKNKKIYTYIALAHHTRFITPVVESLLSHGAQIKYIVGQAERSQEITAIELGLDYSHIFDFVTDKDLYEIQKNYRLLKQSFTNSLKNNFLLGILPVTVTDKTLYSTAVEYIGIRNLLKKGKPDLCFALHELNRWGKMFAFWAKKEAIPFISLQEGLGYNLDFGYSGHAQYSTLNLVWGERVKKKMVGFEAPESKIFPVGNTHLAKEIRVQKEKNIRKIKRKEYDISDNFVTLLILSSILPDPDLLTPIFKTVSGNKDQTIFVKFHPACKKPQMDKWMDSITVQFKNNIHFIHAQENTYNLISMADVCVLGQRSTTGLESIAFGKPIVKLDFAYTPNAPYSFVDQGVAVKMSAEQFAGALLEKTDFAKFINIKKKEQYLKTELIETSHSIEKVCHIFKKTIQANTDTHIPMDVPSQTSDWAPDKKWSIILQVPDNHDVFMAQLEAVAFNSENQGDYEILLLEPEKKSKETIRILASLKGDLTRIVIPKNQSPITLRNKAGEIARGKNLIFLEKNLAPLKGWLDCLDKSFLKYGPNTLFGARISNQNGKIANAGMVVDHNNTPVCAYRHLNMDFPGALKERSFQMVDYFVAMEKNLFIKTGGFTPDAGKYSFLDICMKVLQSTNDPNAVIYLPRLKLIFLDSLDQKENIDDSIYFYGKWNSCLWESENKLHKKDGVSPEDLAHAKMAAAMQSAN
jgi:hypothetical protein